MERTAMLPSVPRRVGYNFKAWTRTGEGWIGQKMIPRELSEAGGQARLGISCSRAALYCLGSGLLLRATLVGSAQRSRVKKNPADQSSSPLARHNWLATKHLSRLVKY